MNIVSTKEIPHGSVALQIKPGDLKAFAKGFGQFLYWSTHLQVLFWTLLGDLILTQTVANCRPDLIWDRSGSVKQSCQTANYRYTLMSSLYPTCNEHSHHVATALQKTPFSEAQSIVHKLCTLRIVRFFCEPPTSATVGQVWIQAGATTR